MKRLKEIFGECSCSNLIKKGKCLIATVNGNSVAIKEKNNHNIRETYDYLSSRGFDYYPKLILNNNKYNVYEYIREVNSPLEQKAIDMMTLLSMLHNKTTFYKEMDINEYKEIFENISGRIEYTINYYNNLMNVIETHVFMSPSEYLIARNISKIMGSLQYSKSSINEWYDLVKTIAKKRVVLLYNNTDINHVVRGKDLYLINWDKSVHNIPIYDLYNFYMRYALNFDFEDLFNYYESKYPLLKEEKLLLYILISIPNDIHFTNNEIENCKNCKNMIDRIYKTEVLIFKNTKEGNTE